MLRIDGKSTLFLSKKEKTLSRPFLKGFAIAIALHFALLIVLRIHSQQGSDRYPLLSPIAVEVDLGEVPSALSPPAHIVRTPLHSITPPRTVELPPPSLIVERPFFNQERLLEADFSEVERIDYEFLEDDDLG